MIGIRGLRKLLEGWQAILLATRFVIEMQKASKFSFDEVSIPKYGLVRQIHLEYNSLCSPEPKFDINAPVEAIRAILKYKILRNATWY
jgi:hypothetical protein